MVPFNQSNFPPTTPPAIASYDFTDLASGTGYETLFGAETDSGDLILTGQVFKASERNGGFHDTTGFTRKYTSAAFNTPRIINGILNILYNVRFNTNGAHTLTLKVYKNDVEIASGEIYKSVDIATEERFMDNLAIPRTKFSKGDTISFELIAAGSIVTSDIMNNPAGEGRTFQSIVFDDTYLTFEVPFEIRL